MMRSLWEHLMYLLALVGAVVVIISSHHSHSHCDAMRIPEEYEVEWLFNISKRQEHFVLNAYTMLQAHRMNPCFLRDPYNETRVLVTWRIPEKSGRRDKVGYTWYDIDHNRHNTIEDWIEQMTALGEGRQPLFAQDVRLFMWNGELYLLYNIHHNHFKEILIGKLIIDPKLHMLYVLQPGMLLSIDHEVGAKHQKNWTPFEYCPDCEFRNGFVSVNYIKSLPAYQTNASSVVPVSPGYQPYHRRHSSNTSSLLHSSAFTMAPDGPAQLFFVYSVLPHRIVYISRTNQSIATHSNVWHAHTLSLTEIPANQSPWEWGEMRGGSPALKINASYYLTFFHSSGTFNYRYVRTYYMGCYLFQAHPPFAITHISPEPIVHKTMYNETIDGWSYGNVDFVVFPMGVIFDERVINVSYGRNDRNGWFATFDREKLLSSLKPVQSKVLGDSEWSEDKKVFKKRSFKRFDNHQKR